MTTHQLEEAILSQYDNGRYSPTGADGGVLKYVLVNINGKQCHASITLDHEIAQIRRIWELKVDGVQVYDHTPTYYKLRKAA